MQGEAITPNANSGEVSELGSKHFAPGGSVV